MTNQQRRAERIERDARNTADRYRRPVHRAPSPIATTGPSGLFSLRADACLTPDARENATCYLPEAGVYRIGGILKLDRRIADFDKEGDIINGYSDRR